MKLNRLFFAASAILLAAACAKEQDVTIEKPNEKPIEETLIKATVRATSDELDAETKTSLASNGSLYWTSGDHITVFDGYGNRDFDSDIDPEAEPTKTAMFIGEINAAATTFVAVYPYNSSASYAEGKITTVLPTTQNAVANSFANNSNVAVANNPAEADKAIDGTDALIKFSFQNVGALLKFTLSQDNVHQSVTIRAFTKEGDVKTFSPIAGEIKVNPATAAAETTVNSETDVTVTPTSGKLAAGSYYAVVLPIDTKFIQFEFSNGTATKKRSANKAISVARSSYYDMGTIDTGLTYPDPLLGDYIIVSKGATSGNWVVMSSSFTDGRTDRWQYIETTTAYDESVDLTDSSVDFGPWSYDAYKFSVEAKDGGYVLKNATSGKYITYAGNGNAGKEVDAENIAKFDTFSKDDGTGIWTMGVTSGSDTYSLQYNVNNYFSFYKTSQASIYLIPYVYVAPAHNLNVSATTVTLSGIEGATESIDVTSNYAWTAVLDGGAAGFTVTSSGAGNGTITITASADGTAVEQTLGTFTVSDGEDNIVVTVKQAPYVSTLTDEVTTAGFASLTSTSYRAFSITSGTVSGANYVGTLASNNPATYLQFNNGSNRGLVTTVSGGRIYSITANWGGSNTNSRYITIYGKNTAYSSASDLYSDATRGTEIGKLTFTTGASSATLDNIPDAKMYEYIGFLASGAMYVTSFDVSWDKTPAAPDFSITEGTYYSALSVELTAGAGATIHYTTDGSTPSESSSTYSSAIAVSSTTTIKAIAIKGGKSSAVASATYTIESPTQLVMSTVSCTAQTHRSLTFAWDEVSNATGYEVSIDNGENWIDNGTARTYIWSGLSASTTYTLKVKALGTDNGQYTDSDPKNGSGTTTAAPTLKSIAVTTNPTKTSYSLGEPFSFAGAVVTATYSDNSEQDVTASCTTDGATVVSSVGTDKDVTVSYTEAGITRNTTFKITVSEQHYYVKVTATPVDWSGEYLIVYEESATSAVIFNGALSTLDGGRNVVGGDEDTKFSIADGKIVATDDLNAATFTLTATTAKSKSGKWINQTSWGNGLSSLSTSSSLHGVSIDGDGNLIIQGSGNSGSSYVQLCFNKLTGSTNYRFRFYKSPGGNNAAIALYKYQ